VSTRKLPVLFCFLFAGFFFNLQTDAQQSYMRNYTVSDGLPSYEVYNVLSDSKGFLWFATDAGVSRYDGYNFRNYTSRDNLPDNTIFDFFEDSHGRIWFKSYSGLLSYFQNEQIVQLPVNEKLPSVLNGRQIISLYVDAGDTIWLGANQYEPLFRILPDFTTIDKTQFSWSKGNYVREMEPGKFLFGTGPEGNLGPMHVFLFGAAAPLSIPGFLDNMVVLSVARTAQGETILSSNSSFYRVKGSQIRNEPWPQSIVRVVPDPEGTWICTMHGGAEFFNHAKDPALQRVLLDGYSVSGVARDREGGLWFTTLDKGVFYQPFPEVQQLCISPLLKAEKYSSVANLQSGSFLAGTTFGKIIDAGCNVDIPVQTGSYLSAMVPHGDRLLVCSDRSYLYDPAGKKMTAVLEKNAPLKFVAAAIYDPTHFFALSIRTIHLVNRETGASTMLKSELPERMRCICRGRGDTVWLGGLSGLWRWVPGSPAVLMSKTNASLGQRIDYLLFDAGRNRLWLSTKGNGLLLVENGNVRDFSKLKPSIGTTCRGIYKDEESNIWVATNAGAFCLIEKDGVFSVREFSIQNGLSSNDIVGIHRHGDVVYIVATDQIMQFRLSKYPSNKVPPSLLLQHVIINGKETGPENRFSYEENTIAFSYVGISYKCDGKVRYRYRLVGADTGWTETQATMAVFYRLAPGKYKFSLYALNNDGVSEATPLEFTFIIEKPFWQRWWFIFSAALAVVLFFMLLLRFRLKQVKRKETDNRKLIEMEMTALRAQMNPHFIFNAINSIHNFVLKGDRTASATYLSKFARLIRNVLEISGSRKIPLAKELETLRLYLDIERMRFSDEFSFEIKVGAGVDPESVSVVPLLLQPYAENAIWHGLLHKKGAGHLGVAIEDAGESLLCIIDDDGIGRELSAKFRQQQQTDRSSMGGELNRRRLDLLNSLYGTHFSIRYIDKRKDDGTPGGTRVELLIPKVSNKHSV
jgi:hypothetical protein